jgi:hypothetical protein
MRARRWALSALVFGWHVAVFAQGQESADLDALALTAQDAVGTGAARQWRAFVEYGVSGHPLSQRLSGDVEWGGELAAGLHATLGDRLDLNTQVQPIIGLRNINTLKEAYLTWQQGARFVLDAGRVNLRYGSGLGYNPTDFFREGSLRSVVSVDPTSLRNNRMGVVVLRQQMLLDQGALAAVYAPKLDEGDGRTTFSPDWGGPNRVQRGLLTASTTLMPGIAPQWLIEVTQGEPAQMGMNLSILVGQATVAHLEWVGGRARSMLADMTGTEAPRHYRNRVATGLTYTTSGNLSVSLEGEYNGLGLAREDWTRLARAPEVQRAYLDWAHFDNQSPPTRYALFSSARWQDAFRVRGFDLTGLVRYNADDNSLMAWAETSVRFEWADVGLQGYRNLGAATSEFGSAQNLSGWQIWLRHYL